MRQFMPFSQHDYQYIYDNYLLGKGTVILVLNVVL